MADVEENERNRFAYLLEPIRDLQKNWDIDLIDLLEKYLHELENGGGNVNDAVGEQLAENGTREAPFLNSQQQRFYTNFAEAALLIQGTAQVYGRKVEYLYQLVFKLWNLLANKNGKDRRLESAEDGADDDNVEGRQKNAYDDDEPFESLDDIQVAGNIDLNESGCRNSKEKSPKLVTPMPLALIPLEDFEKSSVPLVVKTGEIIGKKDDYRVNTCFLHSTGTLLLDLSNSKLIDAPEGDNAMVRIRPRVLSQQNVLPPLFIASEQNISGVPCQVSPESGLPCPADVSPTLPETSVMAPDDFDPLPPVVDQFVLAAGESEMSRRIPQMKERKENQLVAPITAEEEQFKRQRIIAEFWTELNRYEDNGKLTTRPIRKGRTYKIPTELVPKKSGRKRKLEDAENVSSNSVLDPKLETVGSVPKQTLAEFFRTVVYNKRRQFPKNPLKVPLFGELDDLFWEEQKRRRQARLKRKTKKIIPKSNEPFTEILNFEERANKLLEEEDEALDDSQVDRNLHAIFDGSFEGEQDGNDGIPGEPLQLKDDDFHPAIGQTQPESQNRAVEFDDVPGSPAGERSMDNFPTYEDYVQHTVKKYLQKAQQSAALSDLTKRVVEWEEKIRPFLELEEDRRPFDIRLYGNEILDHFKTEKCAEILFCDLARGKERFEVCRLLLASLMLVNQGNIEVSQEGEFEEGVNTMKLKFLTAERHYVQLEELFGAAAVLQK